MWYVYDKNCYIDLSPETAYGPSGGPPRVTVGETLAGSYELYFYLSLCWTLASMNYVILIYNEYSMF
jgi:hypothetical protein